MVGVGLGLSRGRAQDNGIATGTLNGATLLQHLDTGVHVQVFFKPPTRENLQVLIFGGPSHYTVSQQLVTDISYAQTGISTPQTVTITGYRNQQMEASAWGFNAGTDVAFFFRRHVGIGATARYTGGTVQMPDTAAAIAGHTSTQPVKVVRATIGFGLRLRF